jgi:precorrin-6y C5,15-methyltransferase (decarboxylating) CbiE subunit
MSTREISNTVAVVGLGVSPEDLTERQREIIHGADLLVGGRRHLSFFRGLGVHTLEIDRNLGALVEEIENRMEAQKVVVLASGDPLFYGIGAFLIRRLGRQRVRLYSNATAASAAFARIGEPWRQAAVLSLHGRCGQPELLTALRESRWWRSTPIRRTPLPRWPACCWPAGWTMSICAFVKTWDFPPKKFAGWTWSRPPKTVSAI